MTVEWVVFGSGGHARAVIDVIERRHDAVHTLVDGTAVADADAMELAVGQGLPVIVAIGAAAPRERIIAELCARGWTGPALVAATATVGADVALGAGTVVMEHAHVGPNSTVGASAVVNTGAVVEHDCTVGDAVHLGPGAYLLGAAGVGERSFIGSGARVLPGVRVGADCVVGAGAVVLADVADGSTVVGIPARPVRPATKEIR